MSVLTACSTPTGKLLKLAADKGLVSTTQRVNGFELLVLANRSAEALAITRSHARLHVYLEGDGSPWRYRVITMPDPTPRQPLMLRLMALDPHPAVYVGRPCYNGTSYEANCPSELWTSGRYSERVVETMAQAIRLQMQQRQVDEVWLFGHSGGGALAVLLAKRIPQASRILTMAGNLDTDAWTRYHRYTSLFSSINPADQPDLSAAVSQWHLLAGRDTNIPPILVKDFLRRQEDAQIIMFPGYSHGCCWMSIWPDVLDALVNNAPSVIPGRLISVESIGLSGPGSQ